MPLGKSITVHLDDNEVYVTIDEAVRGRGVFIGQPYSMPVNDHLFNLLLLLDALTGSALIV